MTASAARIRADLSTQQVESEAERQARADLAATYRLAAIFGWNNIIYNHIALRVPGESNHFFFKQHELMFEEVTASNLLKLDMEGKAVDGSGRRGHPGFSIHAAVLQGRPDVNCVIHVHPQAGMAISALKCGLLPITQDSMHFYNRVGYNDYDGLSSAANRRDNMIRDLGLHRALILRNHGLLTCADSAALALLFMRYLVGSCETQLMLQAAGGEIIIPPQDVCEEAAQRWDAQYAKAFPSAEWAAMLRIVDRQNPGYKD